MAKFFLIAAGIVLFATSAFATGAEVPAGYPLPPDLLAGGAPTADPANNSPLRLKADDELAAVQLVTKSPISPYLGVSRKVEPEEQGSPSLYRNSEKDASPFADYRLEAGLGYLLNDNATLNIGYRFADPTTALMDPASAALGASNDDLHISFDFKVPF
jgi:opacity protein-like surface antigen